MQYTLLQRISNVVILRERLLDATEESIFTRLANGQVRTRFKSYAVGPKVMRQNREHTLWITQTISPIEYGET